MFAYLKGVAAGPDCVIVDGSVGYQVRCPVALVDGADVELWVVTVVRENDISLYGFADRTAQGLFNALRTARGVGPAAAMALLAALESRTIVTAIANNTPEVLCAAKGIGPKAAQAICAGVNVDHLVDGTGPVGGDGPVAVTSIVADVASGLTKLGYDIVEATDAARHVASELGESTPLPELVIAGLAHIRNAA